MLSIGMMIVDHHYNHLNTLRSGISVVMYPIEQLAWFPSKIYNFATESLSARKKLLAENARLRAEQILLESQLQKLNTLKYENTRLRKLFSSTKFFKKERVIIAELLSIDLDPYRQRIVLNKGTRDGVYAGQPLLGADGIIGQVDKVGPLSSIAILISDPNHALLGVIARSGQRSLIVGTGSTDKLELQHLISTADIQIGDLVMTSGLDGRYPPDYPVAEIVNIQKIAGEAFVKVEAKPLMDLSAIREILLMQTDNEQPAQATESDTEPQ